MSSGAWCANDARVVGAARVALRIASTCPPSTEWTRSLHGQLAARDLRARDHEDVGADATASRAKFGAVGIQRRQGRASTALGHELEEALEAAGR